MKSEWKTTSNYIGKTIYSVFRIKNVNEVVHTGNVEYYDKDLWFDTREEAEALAQKLNGGMKHV
ncbi:MAG: hypothetical protein GX166_03440 [Clostridiaceae bacterium]|jgi:hypothetical protein|nr:hypothetical protein [Clostridiaceae bacterium]